MAGGFVSRPRPVPCVCRITTQRTRVALPWLLFAPCTDVPPPPLISLSCDRGPGALTQVSHSPTVLRAGPGGHRANLLPAFSVCLSLCPPWCLCLLVFLTLCLSLCPFSVPPSLFFHVLASLVTFSASVPLSLHPPPLSPCLCLPPVSPTLSLFHSLVSRNTKQSLSLADGKHTSA